MPQSKNRVFSLNLAGRPHLARVESLQALRMIFANFLIY